jgi:radical SAM protein with 4Fe4S-binding SPASM domain
VRYCGAGHEMIMIDVDGNRYPCHRFSPWVTGRSAPAKLVNRQTTWGPERCAECQLVTICPTCAGFNWQENGDSGIRTTYHCESIKLEVLASAKLQALRLLQQQPENLAQLSFEEVHRNKCRLDAILDFASMEV